MTANLIVVTGTGTEIGKTHFACALLGAWARVADKSARISGFKPIESGVVAGAPSDGERLEQMSTFHVKRIPSPYLLSRPVSPHLAARAEGRIIDLEVLRASVAAVRAETDSLVVELAGGLFTPLAPSLTNVDVAIAVEADLVLLVAPDRLGVLHDVGATTRAARAAGLDLDGIILMAPAESDASTGTNAAELTNVLASLPRSSVADLATRSELAHILSSPKLRL